MNTTNNDTLFDGSKNAANGTIFRPFSSCLPSRILTATNITSVYVSDIIVTIFNIPSAIFAFLVNLAIIVTVIRTPSLHRPVNVLLCGLATSDCLTGLATQPVYVSWRLSLHHTADLCKVAHLFQVSQSLLFLFVGGTFINLAITSAERLYAVSYPIAHSTRITLRGVIKTVVSAWIAWLTYAILLETVAPKVVYQPMESITLTLLTVIPIGGHILTFVAIRRNNRKILSVTHNSQKAIVFKREKKAFKDMALYTVATLLSMVPTLLLLNVENSIVKSNVLFPWAVTISCLVSSFNPIIQIRRNTSLRQALKAIILNNNEQ